MTVIVDYGVGNLFSLASSLRFLEAESLVTRNRDEISGASRIILPGVGAFGDAAEKLRSLGLDEVLRERVSAGVPLLGICLGMQLLFEKSHEFGEHEGLGLIPGEVVPIEDDLRKAGLQRKIPQMGWNALHITQPGSPLLRHTREGDCVYYVHSFYARTDPGYVLAVSEYGIEITGAVQSGCVCGTQFHPEKSGEVGLGILRAFLAC